MNGYILTPTAQADLAHIRDYYLEEAGSRIAPNERRLKAIHSVIH
jgi:plasmid stabilization system protein ParE